MINKIFILLWKLEKYLILYFMKNNKYRFEIIKEGNGLLHKYKMQNKKNKKLYFIKKTTSITDLWQFFALKKSSDYSSLSRKTIEYKIKKFLGVKALRKITPCFLVKDGTIIYRYFRVYDFCSKKEIEELISTINKEGFFYFDIHKENFLKFENKCYVIDLESLQLK